MESGLDKWDRIRHFGEELEDVCQQVNYQLVENRRKREDWFIWNWNWKRRWLHKEAQKGSGGKKPGSGPRK